MTFLKYANSVALSLITMLLTLFTINYAGALYWGSTIQFSLGSYPRIVFYIFLYLNMYLVFLKRNYTENHALTKKLIYPLILTFTFPFALPFLYFLGIMEWFQEPEE